MFLSMKRFLATMAIGCGLAWSAGYEPTSVFFTNPDTGLSYLVRGANFWKQYRDTVNGGYNAVVSSTGVGSGTVKYFSPQSRLAYVFTRAFMVTGDTMYLNYAEHALKFLYAHSWNQVNGGWGYLTNAAGTSTQASTWSYMQHYALLGPTVFFEAHGAQRFARSADAINHWDWIYKGNQWMNQYMWDTTTGRVGYYQYAGVSGPATGKGFTATVDGVTTHGESLALSTQDAEFRDRFLALAQDMLILAGSIDNPAVKQGMPEEFDESWVPDGSNPYSMVGHIVKTVWCLDRAYLFRQDSAYLQAAQRVFNRLWANGYVDTVNGGVYYDYTWSSTMAPTTTKNYWMLEQGFNAGITLAFLTQDSSIRERALRMAEGSANFFFSHFITPEGAALMATTQTGTPSNPALGDEWDAGYHASEFSWLVYLYGHLLHKREPVTLYYRLAPKATTQDIKLSPMSLPGDSLAILSAQKDGAAFTNVDQLARTLHLAANEGGIFKVTFGWRTAAMTATRTERSASGFDAHVKGLALQLSFPAAMQVRVRIVDAHGAIQAVVADRTLPQGVTSLELPRAGAAGIRWVSVESAGNSLVLPVVAQ